MTKHIHAELMAQYAEDAMTTDEPWELWECNDSSKWEALTAHPRWNTHIRYRRKRKTIMLGDIEVPAPMTEAPEENAEYFVVNLMCAELYDRLPWDGDIVDTRLLSFRVCHATKEAAVEHAQALIKLSGGGV